jgi:hypothetical protein
LICDGPTFTLIISILRVESSNKRFKVRNFLFGATNFGGIAADLSGTGSMIGPHPMLAAPHSGPALSNDTNLFEERHDVRK